MSSRWERGDLVWPILLVLAGLVLLLNSLGRFEFSLWELAARLWPAILMAIGVDLLIPRRSIWGRLLAAALILAVFLMSFRLLALAEARPPQGAPFTEALENSQSADVILKPALGSVRVHSGVPGGVLMVGSAGAGGLEALSRSRSSLGSRVVLTLATEASPTYWIPLTGPGHEWDLALSGAVPLTLSVEIGVGSVEVDLQGLDARQTSVSFGVGRAELRFPEAAGVEATVRGGVGEVLVLLPRGVAARLHVSRGLSSLSLPAGYTELDGAISSPAGLSGPIEVEVTIELGMGTVRIEEIEG